MSTTAHTTVAHWDARLKAATAPHDRAKILAEFHAAAEAGMIASEAAPKAAPSPRTLGGKTSEQWEAEYQTASTAEGKRAVCDAMEAAGRAERGEK